MTWGRWPAQRRTWQAREIVGAAHDRLVVLVEKLPTRAERERFWQAPQYAALRRLWAQLAD